VSHYKPEWKGPMEGWVVNFLKTQMWRVAGTMEHADVMQEAYLVFLRCKKAYPKLDTARHFMALYKTAWQRQFTDFANADTASRVITEMPRIRIDDDFVEYEPMGEADNEGYLAILLSEAPREVLMVMNLFLSAPQELIEIALSSWNGSDKRCKAGGSKRINQMLGLPPDLDVIKMTEDYIRQR
jgi:hypothetical protein